MQAVARNKNERETTLPLVSRLYGAGDYFGSLAIASAIRSSAFLMFSTELA